jgi:biotin carboxyl carrier protein
MNLESANNLEELDAANPPDTLSERDVMDEAEIWRQFVEASNSRTFCESWLALQCHMMSDVRCALVLLGTPEKGPFTPAAVWPSSDFNVTHLTAVAQQALAERHGVIVKNDGSSDQHTNPVQEGCYVAYPVDVSGKIHGVIIVHLEYCPDADIQYAAKQLHWGAAWIELLLRRLQEVNSEETHDRLKSVLDAVAITLDHEKFKPAATAFVTNIATTLVCERVSLGLKEGKRVVIRALSHSADFAEKVNMMSAITMAMEEALDQHELIVFPAPSDDFPQLITREHASLMNQYGIGAICTVPLGANGMFWGAITLEFSANKKLSEVDIELIKTIASINGPILDMKHQEDRPILLKAKDAIIKKVKLIIGPAYPTLKVIGAMVAVMMIFFFFAEGNYRAKATTILEGSIQRVISAPFSGYIFEAPKRAGDLVKKGELLCSLDDREQRLEEFKWSTQEEQLKKEFRGAMAKHDRAQILIIGAKLNQTEAQLSLIREQLIRSRMVAPFDGIVTSGDLSHSLGSPVERGQVLFEIAPLDSYRVILQVDERQVDQIKIGQKGELLLPSIPGEVYPLRISNIMPVSTVKEGRNYFRVEAQLEKASPRLRPGMEGVGKIDIGERKLIWIWTHEIINWLRLKFWSWLQ